MPTLFLDTASRNQCIALIQNNRCILQSIPPMGEKELMPAIEKLLQEESLTLDDLDGIACVVGPGGFTSLRVGVSTANALRDALNIKSAGVHLSDVWAARVKGNTSSPGGVTLSRTCSEAKSADEESTPPSAQHDTSYLWLHSTKRTHMFVRGYGADGSVTPIELFTLEDAAQLMGAFTGELLPEHEELLTNDRGGITCDRIPEKNLAAIEEVLPKLIDGLSYDKNVVMPWYGREGL